MTPTKVNPVMKAPDLLRRSRAFCIRLARFSCSLRSFWVS